MKKEEITQKLRKRFCKDTGVPINIYEEPYFTSRLELFNPLYDTLGKWENYVKTLKMFENEQEYFEYYNKVKDELINKIKSKEGYKHFCEEDIDKFSIKHSGLLSKKDIYHQENDGKTFISIDMIQANFNALLYYDPNIFVYNTWKDFVYYTATDIPHIIRSKYIRQVVLGNCNCKRQVNLEKYIMDYILGLAAYHVFGLDEVVFFSNDEIIIKVDNKKDIEEKYSKVYDFTKMLSIPLRTEIFTLHKINGTNGYVKECHITNDNEWGIEERNTMSIKCVDAQMYPFVVRKLLDQKIQEEDRIFYKDGLLCKYVDVPEITISNKTFKLNEKSVDNID